MGKPNQKLPMKTFTVFVAVAIVAVLVVGAFAQDEEDEGTRARRSLKIDLKNDEMKIESKARSEENDKSEYKWEIKTKGNDHFDVRARYKAQTSSTKDDLKMRLRVYDIIEFNDDNVYDADTDETLRSDWDWDWEDWVASSANPDEEVDANGMYAASVETTHGNNEEFVRISVVITDQTVDIDTEDGTVTVTPVAMKWDIDIEDYQWSAGADENRKMAIECRIDTRTKTRTTNAEGDREVSFDGDLGMNWLSSVAINGNNQTLRDILANDPEDDVADDDAGKEDDEQTMRLFFVIDFSEDNGNMPSAINWDPVLFMGDSAATSGAAALSALLVAAAAMLSVILA